MEVAYQNVGGSIETTNTVLDTGRQKRWDIIFITEAWERRNGERRNGERTQQRGYRIHSMKGAGSCYILRRNSKLRRNWTELDSSGNA